jgi:hypothetical protein
MLLHSSKHRTKMRNRLLQHAIQTHNTKKQQNEVILVDRNQTSMNTIEDG